MKSIHEMNAKLDKILECQTEHTILLAKNTQVLIDHHIRTSNLEARVKPLETHVTVFNGVVKVALTLVTALGCIAAIYHYLISP